MRVTATQTQTGRKQQDRSARRPEKRGRQATMRRIRSLIRTVPAASAAMRTSRTTKCLIHVPDQATLTTNGMPLGRCRLTLSWGWCQPSDGLHALNAELMKRINTVEVWKSSSSLQGWRLKTNGVVRRASSRGLRFARESIDQAFDLIKKL